MPYKFISNKVFNRCKRIERNIKNNAIRKNWNPWYKKFILYSYYSTNVILLFSVLIILPTILVNLTNHYSYKLLYGKDAQKELEDQSKENQINAIKKEIDNTNNTLSLTLHDINNYKENILNLNANMLFISNKFNVKLPLNLNFNYKKTENLPKIEDNSIIEIEVASFKIYYERGSLILNKQYLRNNEELQGIDKFIRNGINPNNSYRISIIGKASKEHILNPRNRISNNYELSKARAEDTKYIIDDIIFACHGKIVNIHFSHVGCSNQENRNEDPIYERYASVSIYQIIRN